MSVKNISSKYRLNDHINDTVIFSICGLSSVALCQAFDENFNDPFKKMVINIIFSHFNVDDKIKKSCLILLDGDGKDLMKPYFVTLTNEKYENVNSLDVLQEFLVLFLSQGSYSSRVRYFLRHLSYGLNLNVGHLLALELEFVDLVCCYERSDEDAESIKRNKSRKVRRALLIGAAAVSGGVLIGVTGGLAAPFIATGVGAIGAAISGGLGAFVTGASAVIGSTAGVAVIGSIFGGAGAGLTGSKMRRRVGGLKEFSIEPFSDKKHLTLCIAVSGYLGGDSSDFHKPWESLGISPEQYYLVWESKYLIEMSKSLQYLFSYVKSAALTETLKFTVLGALLSAVVWPSALLTISSVIDNPWSVCVSRAELAGRTLADCLLSADYGRRPVTLIGFSLGARVVFYCLQELASRQLGNLAVEDIIEDVYLIGAPVTADLDQWKRLERVVSSRIVNAYCSSDWVLRFLFRTATITSRIAGVEPVQWANKRMCNMDLSHVVSGHSDYAHKLPEILEYIGVNQQNRTQTLPEGYMLSSRSFIKLISKDFDSNVGPSTENSQPQDGAELQR